KKFSRKPEPCGRNQPILGRKGPTALARTLRTRRRSSQGTEKKTLVSSLEENGLARDLPCQRSEASEPIVWTLPKLARNEGEGASRRGAGRPKAPAGTVGIKAVASAKDIVMRRGFLALIVAGFSLFTIR